MKIQNEVDLGPLINFLGPFKKKRRSNYVKKNGNFRRL